MLPGTIHNSGFTYTSFGKMLHWEEIVQKNLYLFHSIALVGMNKITLLPKAVDNVKRINIMPEREIGHLLNTMGRRIRVPILPDLTQTQAC